ncbi:MAG TPA: TlpA disulfide reductase family protein [Bryobacteraceae bacterium]|nr:TlpA disulfide reductase family protein [Bryobacteraceae bacterium]
MFGRKKKALAAAGTQAPGFQLKGVDGSAQTLQEILKRGPALVAFYKISCPVCQMTAPYLERLSANDSIQVIGVSQDDAAGTSGFMQRFGVTFQTLLDQGSEGYPASNAYGIASVPSMFLIEQDGTIARAIHGFSKRDFEEIGARAGVSPFGPQDHVPEWKAG